MGKPIELNAIIAQTRKKYNAFPPSLRPKKKQRPISSRTPEEATALARAVFLSVKKAEEGFIVKVPGGYIMSWTKNKK